MYKIAVCIPTYKRPDILQQLLDSIAKNNFDQANLNLIIAKYDYVLRSKILDYYSGKLTF